MFVNVELLTCLQHIFISYKCFFCKNCIVFSPFYFKRCSETEITMFATTKRKQCDLMCHIKSPLKLQKKNPYSSDGRLNSW